MRTIKLDNFRWIRTAFAVRLICVALAGCGGGGGGSGSGSGSSASAGSSSATVSGTAATGAPFDGATVTIFDKTGAAIGATTTAADGTYSLTLPDGAVAPFVIVASRDDATLVSVHGERATSTVNITPITNLVAARLSATGNPANLSSEITSGAVTVDPQTIANQVAAVQSAIKPLSDAVGDTTNPLTGVFSAGGMGHDKVLDSLSISIKPAATNSAIQIFVKQKAADETAQPVAIRFTNSETIPAIGPVAAASLADDGTSTLITELLARLTSCHAVPLAQRAAGVSILAAECNAVFLNNDPAAFLSNGTRVSPTGSFSSIFAASGTGTVFKRGNYEWTRANGDVVLSYQWTDAIGNTRVDMLVARPAAGKLYAIGNQYIYSGAVVGHAAYRRFVNQPVNDYYSTGYNIRIPNVTSGGVSIFSKVVVTTPRGVDLTFKPGNFEYLSIEKNWVTPVPPLSGATVVRLGRVYADPSNTGDPAVKDTGSVFSAVPASDAEISQYADHSLWKFTFYPVGGAPVEQYYRTYARAPTIAELKATALPSVTSATLNAWKTASATTPASTPAQGPITLDWTVPAGAVAPIHADAFGGYGGLAWGDAIDFGSTQRSTGIRCTLASVSDAHCTAGAAGLNYSAGAVYTAVDLYSRALNNQEYTHFYALYKLP